MAPLAIYRENEVSTTVISNLFIDEFMGDANDTQLKVYLYLLRKMAAHQSTSVSDIAYKFNESEKEVIRALKYWEKNQILEFDYDEDKTLIGINMRDLNAPDISKKRRKTDVSTFVPMPSAVSMTAAAEQPVLRSYGMPATYEPTYTDVPEPVPAREADPYVKPSYSADEIRAFRQRNDIKNVIIGAEGIIGKTLSPSDMRTILFINESLQFSPELIDYLIDYCVDKGKKDFRYIETVAINWAKEGITTVKQAQTNVRMFDKNVNSIMRELGKTAAATPKELDYIKRWTNQYGFENDIILEACGRAVMSTDRNRFEYADRILTSWYEQNVKHKSDIEKIDEAFKQHKKTTGSSARPASTSNRFSQIQQNAYDFDGLEKALLSN